VNSLSKRVLFLVPIVSFILIWEAFARFGPLNKSLFPPLSTVLLSVEEMIERGYLVADAGYSIMRALVGFTLGSLFGIVIGILTGRLSSFNRALMPLIQLLRPVPPIAFVALALVWFGLGESSKIFLVTWGVFFPVWINTYIGVTRVEEHYINAAKCLGANERTIVREIVLPAALPLIIAGMRTGIALAFLSLVAAEMAGAFVGLGFRVEFSHMVFRVDHMIVCIIALGILGASSDRIFAHIVEKLFPWYMSGR
jgi:ABC-type nitrate/sulfonate/bicarbonate transport system permease component